MTWLAWYLLWLTTIIVVPRRKLCRGLFTRYVLARVIPPRRWWRTPHNDSYRYMLWWGVWNPLWIGGVIPHAAYDAGFWGGYILILLDDYVFGDDDNWRRFKEWAGNKVKWKMELPVPVRE